MKATYFAVMTVQFPTRTGSHIGTYSHELVFGYSRGERRPTRRRLLEWTMERTIERIAQERPSWDTPAPDELAVLFYSCEEEIR